jgi:hypothetical protein
MAVPTDPTSYMNTLVSVLSQAMGAQPTIAPLTGHWTGQPVSFSPIQAPKLPAFLPQSPPSTPSISGMYSPAARSFVWGGRQWGQGQYQEFHNYLGQHGVRYQDWAAAHPGAHHVLMGT